MSIESLTQKLIVDGHITLFEIDLTNYGGQKYYLHGHVGFYKEINNLASATSDIVFQGKTYKAIPIQINGVETRIDNSQSKPTLSVGNMIDGVERAMSALALKYKEFVGCQVTVIDTFVKYLDAVNFVDGNPLASNDNFTQIWVIQQLTSDTDTQLDFALSSPLNQEGVKLPSRLVSPICHWAATGGYRGEQCGYTGTKCFDAKDKPVTDRINDTCAGYHSSCLIRFGEEEVLRHGGFVTAGLI